MTTASIPIVASSTPETAVSPARAVVALGAIAIAATLAITTELSPVGLLPLLAEGTGVTEGVAGLTISSFAIMVAVLAVPLSPLTRLVPTKVLLIAVVLLYGVSNLLVTLAPDLAALCVGRAVGGVAHAVFYSVVTVYASALVPPHRIGRALTVAFAGVPLGAVLGVPAVTELGFAADWRVAFVVLAAAAVMVAGVCLVAVPRVGTAGAMPRRSAAVGTVRTRRSVRGLTVVATVNILLFFSHTLVFTYVSPLLVEAGLDPRSVGRVLLILGAVGVLGLVAAGVFSDSRPRAAILIAAGIFTVSFSLLGGVGGDSNSTAALVLTIAVMALWNIAYGAIPSLTMSAAVATGEVGPSTAGAVINSASNVGIAVGAAVGAGLVAGGSLAALAPIAAGTASLAIVLVTISRSGFRRASHSPKELPR